MPNVFNYSISTDIPGGIFTSAASDRLSALIAAAIPTALQEISTNGNTLTVTFASDLSAGEKTTLDNDTTAPAGGLIGRSADYVQLTANSEIISDLDNLELQSDGIQSLKISGQLKRGDDVSINGFGETIKVRTTGIAPFNKSSTALDGSGAFDFIAGPSFNRGQVNFTIDITNLPSREFIVSFV